MSISEASRESWRTKSRSLLEGKKSLRLRQTKGRWVFEGLEERKDERDEKTTGDGAMNGVVEVMVSFVAGDLTEEVECDKEEGVGVSRCLVLENSPLVQTHGFLTVIKPALVVDNYKCTLPTPAGRPRRTRLKESARARPGYSWKPKLDLCLPLLSDHIGKSMDSAAS